MLIESAGSDFKSKLGRIASMRKLLLCCAISGSSEYSWGSRPTRSPAWPRSAAASVAGENAATARRAAVCLNQLSYSAITGSEAPGQADEMLSLCRSFEDCGDQASINVPAYLSPLRAFLQSQQRAGAMTRSLVDSICAGD